MNAITLPPLDREAASLPEDHLALRLWLRMLTCTLLIEKTINGRLKTDFAQPLGKVSYHVACHLRVKNVGQKTRETLQMVPDTQVNTIERCSGHAGTWGVKKEFHETALKIGRPVFRQMAEHPAGSVDWIASDCQLATHHIEQGMTKAGADLAGRVAHPITLLRMAYGLA